MAGIGFEIKKIYDKNTISNKIGGLFYTSFVTIGPTLACIVMLLIIREITQFYGVDFFQRESLNSAILYAFVFSLLFVSGTTMVLSRYISDRIYIKRLDNIFSSLSGSIVVSLLVCGLIGGIFYSFSPLPLLFKLLSYIMYVELSVIFIMTVYTTAIKDYRRVSTAFVIGVVITTIVALVCIHLFQLDVVISILVGIDMGFLINILFILAAIEAVFDSKQKRHFEFLGHISDFPKLFFINFFYTLGLFIHNIMFWFFSDYKLIIQDTFICAPIYDMATFYSMLTILPSAVLFVLKVETSFFLKYKSFLMTIINGAGLKEIRKTQENMYYLIREELAFIMEIQLLITAVSVVVLTQMVFPYIGIAPETSELFTYLAFAYYTVFMAYLMTTILLYFDAQKEAFIIQTYFVISNTAFTLISIYLGEDFHGLGMAVSGISTLMLALYLFTVVIKNIDYILFSKQPLVDTQRHTWLYSKINTYYEKVLGDE